MKIRNVLSALAVVLFIGCNSTSNQTSTSSSASEHPKATEINDNLIRWFNGEWFYSAGITTVFDLELIVSQDGTVKGKICCSLNEGKREDCSQDDFNLKGSIKGDCIQATFYSMHSPDKQGNVSICKTSENQITWTITKAPDGPYEMLNEVSLYKLN